MRIVCVCTGNLCRSPMAEGVLRAALERRGIRDIEVSSMGVAAADGQPAVDQAINVCLRNGIDIRAHRARRLIETELRSAEHILVMELVHREYVVELCPSVASRTRLFGSFARDKERLEDTISDPIGLPESFFDDCFETIQSHSQRIADALAQRSM